jgi:hypothetical protein
MSDTVENHYWEHPYHLKNEGSRGGGHPKLKTIWHTDKNGKKVYGSIVILWPYSKYMWSIFYGADSRGGLDPNKVAKCNEIKNWCLTNCSGPWFWSIEENSYFIEMGSIRTVGWHKQKVFYLSIKDDADAVHFRLAFDMQTNYKT